MDSRAPQDVSHRNFAKSARRRILTPVHLQGILSDFLRPVALGAAVALAVILIVSLRLPRRTKVGLRSLHRN
jgi:hypothetical protein